MANLSYVTLLDHPIQPSSHLCSHQLVIDKSLAALPRRKTDGAIIIRSRDSEEGKARVFKLNALPSEPILLERYEPDLLNPGIPVISYDLAEMVDMSGSSDSIPLGAHCR